MAGEEQLVCLDYLMAASEYEDFLQLVADFQGMQAWGARASQLQ